MREKLALFVFIPFIIQSVICVLYFSIKLRDPDPKASFFSIFAEFSIIGLSVYFLWHELLQFRAIEGNFRRKLSYFTEITNCAEVLSYFLNFFLVANEWSGRKMTNNE